MDHLMGRGFNMWDSQRTWLHLTVCFFFLKLPSGYRQTRNLQVVGIRCKERLPVGKLSTVYPHVKGTALSLIDTLTLVSTNTIQCWYDSVPVCSTAFFSATVRSSAIWCQYVPVRFLSSIYKETPGEPATHKLHF